MTDDDNASRAFSLKRWSQRKLEAARAVKDASAPPTASAVGATPTLDGTPPGALPADRPVEPSTLPPIDSLDIESDFTAFLGPKVAEGVKRQALKQLFRDPHFNVMDGLDVYIDDYSRPDPIAPELVRKLAQARYIFDPPSTRVNADGVVEDVPPEELAKAAEDSEPERLPGPAPAASPATEDASAGVLPGTVDETDSSRS